MLPSTVKEKQPGLLEHAAACCNSVTRIWGAHQGWMVMSGMPVTETPASVVAGSSLELMR